MCNTYQNITSSNNNFDRIRNAESMDLEKFILCVQYYFTSHTIFIIQRIILFID